MSPRGTQTELERLRGWRNVPARDLGVGAAVERLRSDVLKQNRAVGGLGRAWAEVIPPPLASKTELVRLSRGVLTVHVLDASARFALDRFLRSGGEAELIRRSPGRLRRVRLSL